MGPKLWFLLGRSTPRREFNGKMDRNKIGREGSINLDLGHAIFDPMNEYY
jgi:hypothetical protein